MTDPRELAERWKRLAIADRRDYGDVQANRIEYCAEELRAALDNADDETVIPEIFTGTKFHLANIGIGRKAVGGNDD